MTDQATPTAAERVEKLQGLGCSRKRVEDARFTQKARETTSTI